MDCYITKRDLTESTWGKKIYVIIVNYICLYPVRKGIHLGQWMKNSAVHLSPISHWGSQIILSHFAKNFKKVVFPSRFQTKLFVEEEECSRGKKKMQSQPLFTSDFFSYEVRKLTNHRKKTLWTEDIAWLWGWFGNARNKFLALPSSPDSPVKWLQATAQLKVCLRT